MKTTIFKRLPISASLLALVLLVSSSANVKAQKMDLNGNGMSDVWEQIYATTNLPPNADSDNDGAPNWLESIAGTDPTSALSVPRIPFITHTSSNVTVTVTCAWGKQYQLQSIQPIPELPWTNWVVEATQVARSGTNISLTAPAGAIPKFFRMGIADVDTDGDGLNDWEEYQLGLDPLQPFSNGQMDSSGHPLNDFAYATGKFGSQNVFTISATDATTVQPDPGQNAQDLGVLTVTRGGFALRAATVNLGIGGPGAGFATESVDMNPLPRSIIFPVGVSSKTINVIPLANSNRTTSVIAMSTLLPGTGYTVGQASNASVVIYPSATANGTGLTGLYYTNSSATYSSNANFNAANLKLTRLDTNVDFTWGSGTLPIVNSGYFTVRWTGQVLPQYSETYTFVANTDDGVKLWINDQLIIDNWVTRNAADSIATITLQAGVRYDLKMEYFRAGGSAAVAHLSWYSPSQSKQIIPTSRLYPSSVTPAPTSIVSPLTAVAFLGQPFSYTNVGANSATYFTAAGLPPGLTNNTTNGIISGIPNLAGDFQVSLTASNAVGVSASVVDLQVIDTGSSVTREIWTGVAGSNVSDIPLGIPANVTNTLGTLEGITDYGDNYGERIRGYLTAPVTGNYYFWIAARDSAELWISNDGEPANKVRRAFVSPPGTISRQWNAQTNQQSGWLSLVAGQRYYVEILHKSSAGTNDNWAVSFLQDPWGTNNTPGGIVPGYLLSPYFTPPASVAPGTLYVADLLPATGVTNMAFGTATMRLSADNSRAVISFSFSGISSTVIGEHIDNDPYLGSPSQIMFDISAATPQSDGTYVWFIKPVGTLSTADVLEVLNEGKGYLAVLTGFYPDGELIGHFERAQGSSTFTPPPPPPVWADDHTDPNAASRFLIQSTFGPSPSDLSSVQSAGYTNWLSTQFGLPASHHLSLIRSNASPDPTQPFLGNTVFNDWWQLSITAPDQLRQRVAFALSEIMVVSDQGVLQDNGIVLTSYYDTLLDNAFGNFRDLLKAVSLTPAMGLYLNMQGNDKGSIINGTHANENYAREIMQLFSIGLNREWPDGSLVMTSAGNLVPTYDQNVINGFAATFTGWNYYQTNQGNGRLPTGFSPSANYTNPMVLVPLHHDLNSKLLLDNVVLPPALGAAADSAQTAFDVYCSQDLELALDNIFNNQNAGPFVCRELIQRLVTSHPSSNYLYRVVSTFNNNGAGVRGDLQAVIGAILLDYEARSPASLSVPTFGKQREPVLKITAAARAFPAPPPLTGTYSQTSNQTITISTPTIHRVTNNETIVLSFTSTNAAPTTPSPTTISLGAPGVASGAYTQMVNAAISNMLTASMVTTNVITAAISGHGLTIGNPVYLNFVSGGAASGVYQIINTTNVNSFSVVTADASPHGGACLIPKLTGGGFVVSSRTNVLYSTLMPHGLNPGDAFFVNFTQAGSPADGQYTVATVPDPTHFTFNVATNANQPLNLATVYPLVAPPLNRGGNVTISWSTWALNATDTGSTYSLAETPLNSPTVFNFFFPDYKFPGVLSTAGLTTPEFQLTSDTTTAFQMNFIQSGILTNTASSGNFFNTNGLSSFSSAGNGSGAIVIDLGPWMTPAFTSNAGLSSLVDSLNTRLCGGQLNSNAKTTIVNYAASLPYTTPKAGELRDRARAVVHLILTSPDFTIQR